MEEFGGCDEFFRLYNLEGKRAKLIQTKLGKDPLGITIITPGDLVYAENYDKSLSIVTGTEVHTMIKLHGWRPLGVCSSYCDKLLTVNDSNN